MGFTGAVYPHPPQGVVCGMKQKSKELEGNTFWVLPCGGLLVDC